MHAAKGERPMKRTGFVTLAVAVGLATGLCGCATLLGGGPTDEELVAAVIAEWKAGLEAQDVDKMMAPVSEDFQGDEGGKPELREFMEGAIDQGYIEGAEVILDEAETTIEGATASVVGISVETDMGGAWLDMELKKGADGVWRITAMDIMT
jgi:ketosteroid isomerase-like protein